MKIHHIISSCINGATRVSRNPSSSNDTKVHVTCNLHAALRRIRQAHSTMAINVTDDYNVLDLAHRMYWHPNWVQHELIFPPKVPLLCGRSDIPFDLMISFWRLLFGVRGHREDWSHNADTFVCIPRICAGMRQSTRPRVNFVES